MNWRLPSSYAIIARTLQRPKLNPIVLTALLSPNFECIQRLRQQKQKKNTKSLSHMPQIKFEPYLQSSCLALWHYELGNIFRKYIPRPICICWIYPLWPFLQFFSTRPKNHVTPIVSTNHHPSSLWMVQHCVESLTLHYFSEFLNT
jgi:hypothetical protein